MKLVVRVKLLPTPVQAAALAATLHACNEAATWAAQVAFEERAAKPLALRKHTYQQIKTRWNLGAQAAQHAIKKTCDAYTTLRANLRNGNHGRPGSKRYEKAAGKPVAFRADAAQPYDDRMLSWQHQQRTLSIWTVAGRMRNVAFTREPGQLAVVAAHRRGESDLLCRGGQWYLLVTCDIAEAGQNAHPVGFVGVDLGIVNIATASTGERYSGRRLNQCRAADRTLRTKLQTKNTKSARRRAKKHAGKEKRRARDLNHKISKRIVAEANGGTSRASEAERGGAPVAESPWKI
ncbi:transposase [Streptomyces sp. NPDC050704]|uniref:transposase n=1 Tax=Streptomyces sp. NPDC050704 TaxID=3157219 RepID=UPI00341C485E